MPSKPKQKTLPKELDDLLAAAVTSGDYATVYAALERCLPDARGGYGKGTLLMRGMCTIELARWGLMCTAPLALDFDNANDET